ncbi:MAG: hypothetical protein L0G99_10895, partial [Propionibacteriales bacterium]|nr:hypothetical protein [Propionibacteriales bacterium]
LDGVSSPTPTYVDDCLAGANDVTRREPGRHWGVVAYGLQTDGAPTPATEHRSLYGVGRGALACSPVIVRAGDWASLSCPVELDHTSQRYELSFWSNRQTQLGRVPVRGDLELSVELDGGPVWSGDVHDSTWMGVWVQGFDWQGPVNVTAAVDRSLAGHELTFRLVATRDFADRILDVGLDHIESIGLSVADPGFEDTTAWRSASSGGPLMAWLDHFTPDRPEETCTVVARRYLS